LVRLDHVADAYSITWSAVANSVSGMVTPERLGGDQVHGEIESDRLLDRDFGGLRPAQNLVDELGRAPVEVREVRSIGHQAACVDESLESRASSEVGRRAPGR
jgi:hypothetical protein